MHRLLLLTDHMETEGIAATLTQSGFEIHAETSLPADLHPFDLILVDSNENLTAYSELVRQIRTKSNVPLIALAASAGITECVVTLEMGADDFVPKPVAELELLARIKALLRRATCVADADREPVLIAGDLELHQDARCVRQAGQPIHLTAVEFDLLRILLRSVGTLVTRELIAREVFCRRSSSCNRSIDVHMSGLRKKLGPPIGSNQTERIRTVRGFGYIYTSGDR